jgi:uncharacterized protein YkwD
MARKAVAPALPVLFIAIGLLLSGTAPAAPTSCPDADVPAVQLTLEQFDASIFCMVNRQRASHGFRTLRPNAQLQQAAGRYSNSMLVGQFFSHYGDLAGNGTGSNPIARMRITGYIRPHYAWIVGEDLRWATAETSTPRDVVEAWMVSAIHRMYLLKPRFEDLGVAAIRGTPIDPNETDGVIVAAEFGFRRG